MSKKERQIAPSSPAAIASEAVELSVDREDASSNKALADDAPNGESSDDALRSEKTKVEYETTLRGEEAAHYLRALADGIAHGRLTFAQGEMRLDLSVGDTVELDMKATAKGHKERLSLELRWRSATAPRLQILTR